jgi:hypothetical protein
MERLTRRSFLQAACGAAGSLTLASFVAPFQELQGGQNQHLPMTDEEIFAKVMMLAAETNLAARPIGDGMAVIGLSFLGVPYRAHTLEAPGDEHLVVNLRELDCTTFMENVLVLARCARMRKVKFEEYKKELQFVRYRGGVLNGYPSRLHYFTDWVGDNERKRVLFDVSKKLAGKPVRKTIDFMSTHPESYVQLKNADFVARISEVERALTERGFFSVPRNRAPELLKSLKNGDIIGTVVSMKGIDVSHTGLVAIQDGIPKFLHAPLSGGKVQLAEGSFADYMMKSRSITGVIVARALEP